MKKQYIKPELEVISHDYLCDPDGNAGGLSKSEGLTDGGARETDFFEEDTSGKGFGYRRYNLWE